MQKYAIITFIFLLPAVLPRAAEAESIYIADSASGEMRIRILDSEGGDPSVISALCNGCGVEIPETSLLQAINVIRKTSRLKIFFDDDCRLSPKQRARVAGKDRPLGDALEDILKPHGMRYGVDGDTIRIFPARSGRQEMRVYSVQDQLVSYRDAGSGGNYGPGGSGLAARTWDMAILIALTIEPQSWNPDRVRVIGSMDGPSGGSGRRDAYVDAGVVGDKTNNRGNVDEVICSMRDMREDRIWFARANIDAPVVK
ncbi:MAG TPA: STN domain-containing protein [Candidatus Brocadiia bacterium]|nr:STN domain-containing protein [Candidatus Brocadiia bacterium]